MHLALLAFQTNNNMQEKAMIIIKKLLISSFLSVFLSLSPKLPHCYSRRHGQVGIQHTKWFMHAKGAIRVTTHTHTHKSMCTLYVHAKRREEVVVRSSSDAGGGGGSCIAL